jgi:molybdenum cofactor cytidylyltransferase
MSMRVTVAILAAGRAERFGGGKLDAELAGAPLGHHALEAALDLELGRPLIVVSDPMPFFAEEAARRGRALLALNPGAAGGMASSVALAAFNAAEAGSEALLLMLADMPQVTTATLARLVESVRPGTPACVRHESGHPGIPACFPADFFDALQALEGKRGAAALLREASEIALIHVPHEELTDVDTHDDLEGLRARHLL